MLLARTPARAFALRIDLRPLPWWTLVAFVLSIAATAGVVEEAGYRGYMLTPIRARHGWMVATLVTGTLFFLDHLLSHAYATVVFLPFFLAVSTVHALLVRDTGSIRPSVWLHAIFDAAVLPLLYGLVGKLPGQGAAPPRAAIATVTGVALALGLASAASFRWLRRSESRLSREP